MTFEHYYFYIKPEYLLGRHLARISECGNTVNGANFLTVFCSNYAYILFSFRDIPKDGQRTDDGPTAATNAYLAITAGRKKFL